MEFAYFRNLLIHIDEEDGPAIKQVNKDSPRSIYLDMQATTPVDPRVLGTLIFITFS
jgi:hypothetical protein